MRSFIASGRITGRRESLTAMIDRVAPARGRSDGSSVEIVKSIPEDSEHVLVDRNRDRAGAVEDFRKDLRDAIGGGTCRIEIEAVRKDE